MQWSLISNQGILIAELGLVIVGAFANTKNLTNNCNAYVVLFIDF